MMIGQQTLIRACTGEILFGSRPSGYSGISAGVTVCDGRYALRAYRPSGEIVPTAEALCCTGKYLWEQGIRECPVTVMTTDEREEHLVLVSTCSDRVTSVTAGIGRADFSPQKIPLRFEKPLINDVIPLENGTSVRLTALQFQSPYGVIFLDTVGDCRVLDRGEEISALNLFPKGAEILFAYVRAEKQLQLRAWHRDGSCAVQGNDVCAAVAAAVATGRCLPDTAVTVSLSDCNLRAVCTKDWELFLTLPMPS